MSKTKVGALTILAAVLIPQLALAQAKVGTSLSYVLDYPLSARSAGMADIGVMFTEGDSYLYNPAAIGHTTDRGRWQGHFSVSPDRYGSGQDLYSGGVALRPLGIVAEEHLLLSVALDFAYSVSDPICERVYAIGPESPPGCLGNYSRWKESLLGINAALSWTGRADFSVGLAVNRINQSFFEYSEDLWTIDVGALLVAPFFEPATSEGAAHRLCLGFACTNLTSDAVFCPTGTGPKKMVKAGAAVDFRWLDDTRAKFGFTPALEYVVNNTTDKNLFKAGLEVTFREVVYLRGGYRDDPECDVDNYTYGFSLSTRGLKRDGDGQRGFIGALVNNVALDLHYSFNPSETDYLDDNRYFGLALGF